MKPTIELSPLIRGVRAFGCHGLSCRASRASTEAREWTRRHAVTPCRGADKTWHPLQIREDGSKESRKRGKEEGERGTRREGRPPMNADARRRGWGSEYSAPDMPGAMSRGIRAVESGVPGAKRSDAPDEEPTPTTFKTPRCGGASRGRSATGTRVTSARSVANSSQRKTGSRTVGTVARGIGRPGRRSGRA